MAELRVSKLVCTADMTHEGVAYQESCPTCGAPLLRRSYTVLKRVPKDVWTQVINTRSSVKQDMLIRRAGKDEANPVIEEQFPTNERNRWPYCPVNPTHEAFKYVLTPLCVECGAPMREILLIIVASGKPESISYKEYLKRRIKWFRKARVSGEES